MVEHAGMLSERIRFERRQDIRGLAGQSSDLWRFAFARWAEVVPLSRAEPLPTAADTRHLARRWRIRIRDGRRPELDMRIRWRHETMTISAVEVDPAEPGWLTIWCEDFGPLRR